VVKIGKMSWTKRPEKSGVRQAKVIYPLELLLGQEAGKKRQEAGFVKEKYFL
jgi:hypothetical protein